MVFKLKDGREINTSKLTFDINKNKYNQELVEKEENTEEEIMVDVLSELNE